MKECFCMILFQVERLIGHHLHQLKVLKGRLLWRLDVCSQVRKGISLRLHSIRQNLFYFSQHRFVGFIGRSMLLLLWFEPFLFRMFTILFLEKGLFFRMELKFFFYLFQMIFTLFLLATCLQLLTRFELIIVNSFDIDIALSLRGLFVLTQVKFFNMYLTVWKFL